MKKSHEHTAILLGRRIRSLRNAKGWSQQELGNEADINYKFLGEIERGQTYIPGKNLNNKRC